MAFGNDAQFGTAGHVGGRAWIEIDGKPTPLFSDPKLGHDDDTQSDAERFASDVRAIQRREGLAPHE